MGSIRDKGGPLDKKMAPRLDFSDWWPKDTRKGTPVVVKMENPNYSVVEIEGPDTAFRPIVWFFAWAVFGSSTRKLNRDLMMLTRPQNINLCFHFEVEQQVSGVFLNFFGFNGTAGVWRIKALEESGGWLERYGYSSPRASPWMELSQLEEQKQVVAKKPVKKINKVYHKELALAVRSLLAAQGVHFYFLLFQGVSPFFSWVLTS
ncbi:hypothetical protein HID58_057247 [Brassica napus]|uniref:Uncharacterized protein n=4 Tax=Brassica TaxID=3705 RepID=A0ABQ8ARI2_BRANA|nr:hypothetical protein HID58_057247 [Brassica napus]